MTTKTRTFQLGERVEYSDLSPWEFATVVSTAPGHPGEDYLLMFDGDTEPLAVSVDGMRHLGEGPRSREMITTLTDKIGQAPPAMIAEARQILGPLVPRVLASSEVDCDGQGFAWHRVRVPVNIGRDHEAAAKFAVLDGQLSGSHDVGAIYHELPADVWNEMDDHDRDYWRREGYHSIFNSRRSG